MIKVFIDESPLEGGHAVRGIGSYTRNLIEAFKKQKEIKLVTSIELADVVHYPYFDFFFDTLSLVKKPTVVTIFDTIPLIYPEHYPTGIKGKINFWRQKRKLKDVEVILTISETSKKDIVRFLDIPQEKIHVVYLAPGREFRKLEIENWKLKIGNRYSLPERFILYVGDVNYNKNIPGLLKAFKLITNHQSPITIVLVGEAFKKQNLPETKLIIQLIELLNLKDRVITSGFILEEDLVYFYNLATVYCHPSFYEGFGLPILEAMACGTPVVAAKTQALVEVGEDAALFVDPQNPQEIADGILKVINNEKLRMSLVKSGLENIKKFSWEKTAGQTVKVYQKVLKC